MHGVLRTLVIAVAIAGVASTAAAQNRWISGTLSNFDVWNNTGQDANDFHVVLEGIDPSDIGNLYTGDYPNVTVADTGTGTSLTWTGSTTPSGSAAHFGFTLNGNVNFTSASFQWTMDAVVTDDIPDAAQQWRLGGTLVNIDDITNRSQSSLWIQRRVNTALGQVDLNDLLMNGLLWNTATLIDPNPLLIDPDNTLLYEFDGTEPAPYYDVMMYDVYADDNNLPGDLLMTFLNASQIMPEPTSLALLGLGGLVLMRRRR